MCVCVCVCACVCVCLCVCVYIYMYSMCVMTRNNYIQCTYTHEQGIYTVQCIYMYIKSAYRGGDSWVHVYAETDMPEG